MALPETSSNLGVFVLVYLSVLSGDISNISEFSCEQIITHITVISQSYHSHTMTNNERILGEEHILQCQEAFGVFDPNNKGLVATKDLGNLLRVLGINPTNEELQAGTK